MKRTGSLWGTGQRRSAACLPMLPVLLPPPTDVAQRTRAPSELPRRGPGSGPGERPAGPAERPQPRSGPHPLLLPSYIHERAARRPGPAAAGNKVTDHQPLGRTDGRSSTGRRPHRGRPWRRREIGVTPLGSGQRGPGAGSPAAPRGQALGLAAGPAILRRGETRGPPPAPPACRAGHSGPPPPAGDQRAALPQPRGRRRRPPGGTRYLPGRAAGGPSPRTAPRPSPPSCPGLKLTRRDVRAPPPDLYRRRQRAGGAGRVLAPAAARPGKVGAGAASAPSPPDTAPCAAPATRERSRAPRRHRGSLPSARAGW